MPGRAIGRMMVAKAPQIDSPSTSAASSSSVGDAGKLVAHDPDDDGQHRQRVEQDQPDARVEQVKLP
jgi:hypothetical protein